MAMFWGALIAISNSLLFRTRRQNEGVTKFRLCWTATKEKNKIKVTLLLNYAEDGRNSAM